MDMGQKIHSLRTQNGMTLEDLGNRVGVGKSTVRKWENGMIANMKRDKILKVSEALGTTPAYLMGWEDANGFAAPVSQSIEVIKDSTITPPLNNAEKELIEFYRSLNKKGKDKALDSVRDLTYITFYCEGEEV